MTEPRRPDPDALLALVQAEGGRAERARGRLKVFFGATAGVGKTYAMLQGAQDRRRAGVDVVVGLVETHRRRETEALLDGLELLPRRALAHRGVALGELDLDAALARRPQLLLVDELAHTNAPGSRHEKRWQDVEELVGAGIDVYTTLNVQHLESLNDVVARVTGVTVRETMPDAVLERADEVELVDLPPEELLARLREGKVYLPEQAERALGQFFRMGNLTALRQMALLRTADRVDRQMEVYRRAQGAGDPWAVRDRLLVGIGPAPSSERLIRATKRMADRIGAEWVAAFVEVPAGEHWAQGDRDRVWESLRLAEQLGARTVTLSGEDAATEILRYAAAHNVTRIVVGKPTHATWRDLLGLSFHDRIVRGSGAIDVHVITGDAGAPRPERTRRGPPRAPRVAAYACAALVVAAFGFILAPPHFTFAVSDTQYLVTFAVMLLVGLVVGSLTARLRAQAQAARRREWRTAFMYDVTRDLAQADDEAAMLALVVPRIGAALDASVDVLLGDGAQALRVVPAGMPDDAMRDVAAWVLANRQAAGAGTDTFATDERLFLPLATASHAFGVLRIRPAHPERLRAPEQLHLLAAVASQLAAAMERARLAAEWRRARQLEEVGRLKSEFVAVASRELRAPLAGLAHHLASLGAVAPADGVGAGALVAASADLARVQGLVDDLLDLSRLEAGRLELARRPHAPAALVAAALHAVAASSAHARAVVHDEVARDLPHVDADARRASAVLAALLDNALRFAGAAGHVVVSADVVGRWVQLSVADDGPGVPLEDQARIFDKFVRLDAAGEGPGLGLGLAVAREIVHRHGGAIWVDSGPGPGSVFSFTLPVAEGAAAARPRPADT